MPPETPPRLYQAVLSHLQSCLWNDQRNAHTFAWMVTGFLCSQRASIPSWLPHVQSRANVAQRVVPQDRVE